MRDREETVYDLARLGLTRDEVTRVLRDLPAIQRGHEAACNWPDDQFGFERRGYAAWKRVDAILSPRGLTRCKDDPRGPVVEIVPFNEGGMCQWDREIRIGAPGFTSREIERLDRAARSREASTR